MTTERMADLRVHADRLGSRHLRELIEEAGRLEYLRYRVGPLHADLTKQRLDPGAWNALGAWVEACDWEARRDAMFRGEPVNASEGRAVLHTALRASGSDLPPLAPPAILAEIERAAQSMAALVDAVYANDGARLGLAPGITDIVNVGIGGSDLGPRLAVEALSAHHMGGFRFHFLPNVDGHQTSALMRTLDPRRTLVLLVSKTFGTQETLLNGRVLQDWVASAYGGDTVAAARHFIAVSANVPAAQGFGIPPERVLPLWDYVGGRYSVWSNVGLVLALAIGMEGFRDFLRGGAQMDDHFRSAPWQSNLPVWMALTGAWNRNVLGYGSLAVVPYHDGLRELPAFLQQLEMESLGKRVRPDGSVLAEQAVPVVWGSVGSNAQHAYFQALHQGTEIVPVDFVGVVQPAHDLAENHDALLANLLAQGSALAVGKSEDEALAELAHAVHDERTRLALAAQKTFPGNRPSTTLLLDALTPRGLGCLVALYEHKVFVQSVLWDINAFDQWGVELGKTIAKRIQPALGNAQSPATGFDASTRALIDEIHKVRAQ